MATPEIKLIHRSCYPYASSPQERFLVRCISPSMRLAEHLTALRAWCKQCLPGRLKADVLRPGIVGMPTSMVIRLRPCMVSSTPTTTTVTPCHKACINRTRLVVATPGSSVSPNRRRKDVRGVRLQHREYRPTRGYLLPRLPSLLFCPRCFGARIATRERHDLHTRRQRVHVSLSIEGTNGGKRMRQFHVLGIPIVHPIRVHFHRWGLQRTSVSSSQAKHLSEPPSYEEPTHSGHTLTFDRQK